MSAAGGEIGEEMAEVVRRVLREERGRVLSTLIRRAGDIDRAEELLHEALLAAVEQWPRDGIPREPAAWLTAVARRRLVDVVRQERTQARTRDELTRAQLASEDQLDGTEGEIDVLKDDQLRLVFVCCHPELATEQQVALTLRLVVGLEVPEIARAFVVPESTVAQRLVRAKRAIAERRLPYEVPGEAELGERLEAVLSVLYLLYNEGYLAHRGEALGRADLARNARRLAAHLVELLPGEAETWGLAALMDLQASREEARVGSEGQLVPLAEQDRAAWDTELLAAGLARLESGLGLAARRNAGKGTYLLQAALAACHARAATWEATDWHAIIALYDELYTLTDSPVVALNRAIAVGMAHGASAGLAAAEAIADSKRGNPLERYAYFHATRGDFLQRLGRTDESATAFTAAIACTENDAERLFLRERLRASAESTSRK